MVIYNHLIFLILIIEEDGELKRTLQSLALGKARVLLKSTKVSTNNGDSICMRFLST